MANIVSGYDGTYFFVHFGWKMPVMYNGCLIRIWSGGPHDQHFPISASQSQMYLPMPRLNQIHTNPSNIQQLSNSNFAIGIRIKHFESFPNIIFSQIMLWLHLLEIL